MTLKGSVTVFVLIMLGLVIGLYLFGYRPIGIALFDDTDITTITATEILTRLKDIITSPLGLTTLGITLSFTLITRAVGGAGTAGYIVGSLLPYLIVTMIVFAFANIFFFPVIGQEEMELHTPTTIYLLLTVIFNTLLLLTIVSFVSGRD